MLFAEKDNFMFGVAMAMCHSIMVHNTYWHARGLSAHETEVSSPQHNTFRRMVHFTFFLVNCCCTMQYGLLNAECWIMTHTVLTTPSAEFTSTSTHCWFNARTTSSVDGTRSMTQCTVAYRHCFCSTLSTSRFHISSVPFRFSDIVVVPVPS